MKFYEDNQKTIYQGDCRHMSELPDESVHCVITSPPYWGLRKYEGKQDLIWGGDKENCEHQWDIGKISLLHENRNFHEGTQEEVLSSGYKLAHTHKTSMLQAGFCSLCGAWKGQFGLEPTPELYVQHTVEILREIRRVLREDGVVFWNIGDSYASSWSSGRRNVIGQGSRTDRRIQMGNGLKEKDLCLIPFRIALAAQSDGWWVRSVIIWNKPNPMPESINGWRWEKHRIKVKSRDIPKQKAGIEARKSYDNSWPDNSGGVFLQKAEWIDCPGCAKCLPNDGLVLRKGSWRPTNSYEFILMLTKSDDYYCDTDAVREPHKAETIKRYKYGYRESDRDKMGQSHHGKGYQRNDGSPIDLNAGRNLRDVWTFPTTPFPSQFVEGEKLDHFAVFPEKLPELCIKAATSEKGCCPKCGAPWARITETSREFQSGSDRSGNKPIGKWANQEETSGDLEDDIRAGPCVSTKTLDWKPTCNCGLDPIPCTVLDPFAGAGTTLLVATKLGRKSIGYDISESYCKMTMNRNRQGGLV